MEIQPYAEDGTESCYTNLKPDMVIIDRRTNDVHLFVVSIADDADLAEVQRNVVEQYQELVELMSVKAGSDAKVTLHTVEIGSYSGLVSETTKFTLWEIYKLTTRAQVNNEFLNYLLNLKGHVVQHCISRFFNGGHKIYRQRLVKTNGIQ